MCDNEKLISLVENRPAIYNYKLREHSNKKITDKLWEEIGIEMKCTGTEAKNRWATLRNTYTRCLRNENYIGKKRRVWYLADNMTFVRDYINLHKPLGSSILESQQSIDENITNFTFSSQTKFTPEYSGIDESITMDYPVSESPREIQKEAETMIASNKIADPMVEYLQTIINKKDNEDPNLTFFKSLLRDTNKLSERRQRVFKQNVLINLNMLLDEQENYDDAARTATATANANDFIKAE